MKVIETTVSISQRGRITRNTYKTYFISLKGELECGDTVERVAATLYLGCQNAIIDRAVKDGVELE